MNLIICCTPLQVIIAEKIIEQYPNEEFYGVMLCAVKNKKFEYYYSRLSMKCKVSTIQNVDLSQGRLNTIKNCLKIKELVKYKIKFDRVFLANINSVFIGVILKNNDFSELYTFDDGTVNIYYKSDFYISPKIGKFRRVIKSFLIGKYDDRFIKNNSLCHYSIFKGKRNIINNVKFLDLLSDYNEKNETKNETMRIFLGQPIYELISDKNLGYEWLGKMYSRIIKELNIDFYMPHPREIYRVDGVNDIDTDLIIEDYIVQNSFNGEKYVLYTLFSSAALSLTGLRNVRIISIRPNEIKSIPELDKYYTIMEENKVEIHEI